MFLVGFVESAKVAQTCAIVKQWCREYGTDLIRLLKLRHNHGKGGAVRKVRHTTNQATVAQRRPFVTDKLLLLLLLLWW